MKTEFLKELGLTEDQIKSIMAENGKDIQKVQEKLEAERDNYKGQLETAQKSLKEFEGVDVKDLQGKIETLKNDLRTKEETYQKELAERDFNSLLDGEISTLKPRDEKAAKAIKALLDIETLKGSKNQQADIKSALETVKTESDYLFASNEPIKNPVKPTGNPAPGGNDQINAVRVAMGLKPTE